QVMSKRSRSSRSLFSPPATTSPEEPLVRSPSDPSGKPKKKPKRPKEPLPGSSSNVGQPNNPRDLSAVLAYGPSFLPYTSAWTDSRTEQVRGFKRWIFVAINKIAKTIASRHPNISHILGQSPSDLELRSLYHQVFPGLPESYISTR